MMIILIKMIKIFENININNDKNIINNKIMN